MSMRNSALEEGGNKVATSFNDEGKTLSKNALYAPLIAYEQRDVEPSIYMSTQASIPSILREASLVSFLQKTSFDYHRNRARGSDAKNNGSKPIAIGDVRDRMKQKAVTIVGGGINASLSSIKPNKPNKLKRKRKDWDQVQKLFESEQLQHSTASVSSVQFLRKLNSLWNEYISSAIHLDDDNRQDISRLKRRFIALRDRLHLVGAHVKIITCNQKKHSIGMSGVLIGESMNVWKLVVLRRKKLKKQKQEKVSSENIPPKKIDITETLVIPKKGSSIGLIIPFSHQDKVDSDDSTNPEKVIDEIVIESDISFCIELGIDEKD